MFGFFKGLFRSDSVSKKWNPPNYWQCESHMSAYDRYEKAAAMHRERLARDTGIY